MIIIIMNSPFLSGRGVSSSSFCRSLVTSCAERRVLRLKEYVVSSRLNNSAPALRPASVLVDHIQP